MQTWNVSLSSRLFCRLSVLRTVIPGLSVRIGKAAVLAAFLNAVTEGAVMLLSCFYKACSFPVQRPRWSENAASCEPSTSAEIWLTARFLMLAPAFFWKWAIITNLKPHNKPFESVGQVLILLSMLLCHLLHPLLMPAWSPWAVSLGSRAWVSCLMPEAHQAWSKQADTRNHTYQTGTQFQIYPLL